MTNLRNVERMEWLKVQEEFILWTLDLPPVSETEQLRRETENELQIVREIKSIVQAYEGGNE